MAWASLAAWTPPIRVAAVPVIPVRIPAASSAATARNEVVVLPSVPVIPTTARSWLGSPYHHAAAVASAGARIADDELRQGHVRERPVHERRGGARGGGGRHEVVPVGVEPGDGHEQRPVADVARVVGHAPDRDRGQTGRPDRPAVQPRAAQAALGRQALDEPAERGRLGRFGGGEQVGDRRLGHRRSSRAARLARRPAR